MMQIEVDKVLLKRWFVLFILRVLVFASHFISVMDALASMKVYPTLKTQFTSSPVNQTGLNVTKTVPVLKPARIGYCNMKTPISVKDLDSAVTNYNMSVFMLFGFLGIAFINFIIKTIVHLRLAICPIWQEPDALGRVPQTMWDQIRDMTFNLATFPCDMAIMSCIVGLFTVRRGRKGLGCWECYLSPTCKSTRDFFSIIDASSVAVNLNFLMVFIMVFYKGYIAYYRSTDPGKCDCPCNLPRCVTGCFVSLVVICVVMMPPFLVLSTNYYSLKEVSPDSMASIFEKMMVVGIIIWVVIGIFVFCIMPLKMCLFPKKKVRNRIRDKNPKKKESDEIITEIPVKIKCGGEIFEHCLCYICNCCCEELIDDTVA